jgi:rod shape-determining protein MreC
MSIFLSISLIVLSAIGILSPVENVASRPLNFLSGIFSDLSTSANDFVADLSEIQSLRERNGELEEQLILTQAELIELREIAIDYQRLSDLVDYTTRTENRTFASADVISFDSNSFLRNIVINKGTRDGIAIGMPVVTELGLIGRINDVAANASRVQLITDQNSFISSRLQTTRSEGIVEGRLTGNLRMKFIPLGQAIQFGDLVVTSGLGGNLPPDLVIGQVESARQFEFELFQTAEVRSLVDFDNLEIVLVITSFEPIDLSVFADEGP